MKQSKSSFQPTRPTNSKSILDLDDACLIHVFNLLNPLPDLFNAARSCKRFRDLVHTRRSWLLVVTTNNSTAAPTTASLGVAQQYRQQFTSLNAAITSSRPGDTILLEPGIHQASNLVITHPLQLVGDVANPDAACTLRSTTNTRNSTTAPSSLAFPVLNFAATAGKVSNLAIEGGIGGCIAHYKGRLAIEECSLRCDARGLRHLAAPLVSFASCTRDTSTNSVHKVDSIELDVTTEKAGKKVLIENAEEKMAAVAVGNKIAIDELIPPPPALLLPIGPGIVSVIGCTMQGGSSAVKVQGTGAVESVRVIYESHKALFWFDVDSNSALGQEGREQTPSPSLPLPSSFDGEDTEAKNRKSLVAPSWVENRLARGFDPRTLQAHVALTVKALQK